MAGLKIRFGQALCDFGLWLFTLGPLDEEDREYRRKLLAEWRRLELKKCPA